MPQNELIAELAADLKEHITYLKEIGVSDMNVDLSALTSVAEAAGSGARSAAGKSGPERVNLRSVVRSGTSANVSDKIPELKIAKSEPAEGRKAGSRLASLPSLKDLTPSFSVAPKPEPAIEVIPEHADPTETIPEIRAEIGPNCVRCKLSQLGRKQVVNSVGNFDAELMFVGEAPGADEDDQGEPFVGRAGQLLTDIIEKGLGIRRTDCFIGNINRCRPPKNRAPEPDESVVCKPFLLREIAVVRPKVIVVLGATAAQNLLETKVPIGKLRGRFHDYHGSKVMPTFHPAYLLRDPHKKREVWEDMKLVRDHLQSF